MAAPRTRVAQAWIELRSDDPEAVSSLQVARAHLEAGRTLGRLRRFRLIELSGRLPDRDAIESLLHRSIQFYNPHKERCQVRAAAADTTPLAAGEHAVLVFDRGDGRRGAAERWWLHETGDAVEVREGVVWALGFDPAADGDAERARDLTLVRGRRHGLLCNPHAQEWRVAEGDVPLAWMTPSPGASEGARPKRTAARRRGASAAEGQA